MFTFIRSSSMKILKLIIFLFLEVLIFFIINKYFHLITITDFGTVFAVILSLSVINALLWPIISYYSLYFIVFTLGFGTFLIDGVLLWIISHTFGGFTIEGVSLFTVPLVIAIVNSVISIIFNMDIDQSYYNRVLKNQLNRNEIDTNKEAYLFVEIDGLAGDVLEEALTKGYMPYLKLLLNSSHKLIPWHTDLSSQTGASQAGILHGNNDNLVAFRWVEKENDNQIIASNSLYGAQEIERRISDSHGLLSNHGASRSNLFSGDAEDYILTYSKFEKLRDFYSESWYYLYSTPYSIARILVLFLFDMLMEVISRIRHLLRNKKPRLHRGLKYFVARAGANVVMREATTFLLLGDIYAGDYDVIYSTYMGYDEIAHHSGIRDFDSFYALRQIDNQFKHILNAISHSRRKYNLIVLSDHGQSQGPTFKQKYGKTLNQLVQESLPEKVKIHSILHSNDDHFIETFKLKPIVKLNKDRLDKKFDDTRDSISEHIDNTRGSISERIDNTKGNIEEHFDINLDYLKQVKETIKPNIGTKDFREKISSRRKKPMIERLDDIIHENELDIPLDKNDVVINDDVQSIVLASGNLGLIYFTDWGGRMTYEQIEDAFPNLIRNLTNHPGIGFLLVKSAIYGSMVMSDENIYYLEEDKYVGEHFLDKYGKNIIKQLKRTDKFKHVPDILVNSTYDIKKDEVYAFEELIGSHGGAGGTQQEPFILCPRTWSDVDEIFGAENVHKFFKENMNK